MPKRSEVDEETGVFPKRKRRGWPLADASERRRKAAIFFALVELGLALGSEAFRVEGAPDAYPGGDGINAAEVPKEPEVCAGVM